METTADRATIIIDEVLDQEGQTLFRVQPVNLDVGAVCPTSKEWPTDEMLEKAAYLKCSNGQKLPLLKIESCPAASSHLHFKI